VGDVLSNGRNFGRGEGELTKDIDLIEVFDFVGADKQGFTFKIPFSTCENSGDNTPFCRT